MTRLALIALCLVLPACQLPRSDQGSDIYVGSVNLHTHGSDGADTEGVDNKGDQGGSDQRQDNRPETDVDVPGAEPASELERTLGVLRRSEELLEQAEKAPPSEPATPVDPQSAGAELEESPDG